MSSEAALTLIFLVALSFAVSAILRVALSSLKMSLMEAVDNLEKMPNNLSKENILNELLSSFLGLSLVIFLVLVYLSAIADSR